MELENGGKIAKQAQIEILWFAPPLHVIVHQKRPELEAPTKASSTICTYIFPNREISHLNWHLNRTKIAIKKESERILFVVVVVVVVPQYSIKNPHTCTWYLFPRVLLGLARTFYYFFLFLTKITKAEQNLKSRPQL